MLHRSSDYIKPSLMLLRFHFKPSVSFTFCVVICDFYILWLWRVFPLRQAGGRRGVGTEVWKNRIAPYSIHSISYRVLLWACPCAHTPLPCLSLPFETFPQRLSKMVRRTLYLLLDTSSIPLTHRLINLTEHLLCAKY